MKIRICGVLLMMILSFAGCDSDSDQLSQTQPEEVTSMHTIVAVGDSLTAGYGVAEEESYPALIERRLEAEGFACRVINSGVSGETTSGTLARMDWVLQLQPDIVILESGANDGLRGIEPKLVESNLRKILQMLEEHEITVVLAGMKMVWNLGPDYVARFNAIYPELAKEFDAVFYPFFLDGVAMQGKYNQADGVHPNAAGYEIIAEKIYPTVVEAIKKRE